MDDANRRALTSVVGDRHTPVTETDLQPADLYLVDDASLPQYQEALEAHKAEQAPVFCPVVLIRRDRTPVTVDLPPPDPDRRPLLINEVVTAPVERQSLFRRMTNLLVRRRQTRDLREQNERLEQFASTLRHELRNPLQILDGYLDIAHETGEPEAFERCRTAIDRMNKLFEEVLFILEEEDPEIERETVDLAALCEECWDIVSESAAELEIRTTQQLVADEDRVVQLLDNLFRNAVEHGGPDVTITVGDIDGGFYIADDGPGIPEKKRDIVFKENYSTCPSGTGIGLAVVRAITDAHGWDIRVTGGTAGGARFEITF
ncbi:MAG: sensor histidine kinase [Haloferacaceae archaeon]